MQIFHQTQWNLNQTQILCHPRYLQKGWQNLHSFIHRSFMNNCLWQTQQGLLGRIWSLNIQSYKLPTFLDLIYWCKVPYLGKVIWLAFWLDILLHFCWPRPVYSPWREGKGWKSGWIDNWYFDKAWVRNRWGAGKVKVETEERAEREIEVGYEARLCVGIEGCGGLVKWYDRSCFDFFGESGVLSWRVKSYWIWFEKGTFEIDRY